MTDPLAITDEEALGLARLAQAQLRLATRLAERALDEPDAEAACGLARASERVARGYRHSLLLKSRLRRERDLARREAAANPIRRTPQEQSRVNQRIRQVHGAVERLACERLEHLDDEAYHELLAFVAETLREEGKDDGFMAEALETQVERMWQMLDDAGFIDAPDDAPAHASADTS